MEKGSSFLQNLKNAVETGEFNSDAAKKINAIDEAANSPKGFTEKDYDKAKDLMKSEAVTAEEAAELNSAYELEMKKIQENDLVNKQVAMLIDIEYTVSLSIKDMKDHMDNLMETFEEDKENPNFAPLFEKIEEVKKKYSTFE